MALRVFHLAGAKDPDTPLLPWASVCKRGIRQEKIQCSLVPKSPPYLEGHLTSPCAAQGHYRRITTTRYGFAADSAAIYSFATMKQLFGFTLAATFNHGEACNLGPARTLISLFRATAVTLIVPCATQLYLGLLPCAGRRQAGCSSSGAALL